MPHLPDPVIKDCHTGSVTEPRDHWSLAKSDAQRLQDALGQPDAALVLGSGWSAVGESLGVPGPSMDMSEFQGVPSPSVTGHRGSATSVDVGGVNVLVLAGRSHLYEGHPADTVVHAVRAAVMAGARTVLLTNAAGSLRPEVGIGRPVVISDQLNLTGSNPMTGDAPPDEHGSRFVDLTGLYSQRLRELALAADPDAVEGVYAGLLGGSFETPAEIRMLAGMGADVVGMSTVLEAIAARHLGAEVFAVALVTNLAAGLQDDLDHTEVLQVGARSSPRLASLLRSVLRGL